MEQIKKIEERDGKTYEIIYEMKECKCTELTSLDILKNILKENSLDEDVINDILSSAKTSNILV